MWTSGAQFSDYGTIIVRTDRTVPKHQGITMFIVDMHRPGVTVRPLTVASGGAPFNEVFFDDVEVPFDANIGEVNDGWRSGGGCVHQSGVRVGPDQRYRRVVAE